MNTSRRNVVVTGAESGIGAACAKIFGEAGDHVAILYHSDGTGAEASAEAVRQAGGEAITIQCSVDDEASVEAAFTQAETARGPASVLVNSAGINMSGIPVREMELKIWTRMLATDLTGAFLTSRRFLRAIPGPGAIVHISSIHAEAVRAGGADYCSAKGGLTNLVRTLAIEEAPNNVRINAIEPGMILTPMNARAIDDIAYRKSLEANIPMKRAGRPEEVAYLARWLASNEAAYVTGASIVMDGGLSLLQGVGA
ncbi:SDR family NAD(P)-dependent oxidoreductase [Asticcacaulis solisilvae]|uniref:SDR family NAD(P)-dependent oxidoreductase n=1 Tax=Asticcacaulis solisilvae TaxID=1217274 RepID=UPI003FD6DBEC